MGRVRTGSRGWMFDSGCAAVSVLDSRTGYALTQEIARRTRTASDAQVDVDGDGDIVHCFVCVYCAARVPMARE